LGGEDGENRHEVTVVQQRNCFYLWGEERINGDGRKPVSKMVAFTWQSEDSKHVGHLNGMAINNLLSLTSLASDFALLSRYLQ
jgi:hypothetical protein